MVAFIFLKIIAFLSLQLRIHIITLNNESVVANYGQFYFFSFLVDILLQH